MGISFWFILRRALVALYTGPEVIIGHCVRVCENACIWLDLLGHFNFDYCKKFMPMDLLMASCIRLCLQAHNVL